MTTKASFPQELPPMPDRESHVIQSRKLMIRIDYVCSGLHAVTALSKGTRFNARHSITEILQRINRWCEIQGVARARRLNVHADHPKSHTARVLMSLTEGNMMRKAARPSYSLDSAPPHFFLFDHMKSRLTGWMGKLSKWIHTKRQDVG
jgi:hypothetical protein